VGEFGVENVTLNKLAPLYEDLVNFEIRDGVVTRDTVAPEAVA
jgi:hypothetical protein